MEEINTKIMGVTGTNEDGVSRQVIISKHILVHNVLDLEPEPTEKDKTALAVYLYTPSDEKFKLGYINPSLAPRLIDAESEGKQVMCMVMEITGRGTDQLGLDCYISIATQSDLDAEKAKLEIWERKEKLKKRYEIKPWRAWVGSILFFFGILLIISVNNGAGWLAGLGIFILPSVFLLLPWWRRVYDQVVKLFARKQQNG